MTRANAALTLGAHLIEIALDECARLADIVEIAPSHSALGQTQA
jgi:hypothetical protein